MASRSIAILLTVSLAACTDSASPAMDATLDASSDTPDTSPVDATANDTVSVDTGASDARAVLDAGPRDTGAPDVAPPTPLACMPPALLDLDSVGTRDGNAIHYTGSTVATPEALSLAAPSCQSNPGHALVLAHTMRTTSRLRADTNNPGTDYDTVLWALDRCAPAGATELGCGDDTGVSPRETASTFVTDNPVAAGTTVYIVVAGYGMDAGNFEITVSELVEVAAGGNCDASGVQNVCAAGLVCQDATGTGGATTCSPPAYVESDLPDGVFRDACAQGMVLPLAAGGTLDDGHSVDSLAIPFAFTFFGRPVTSVWPSTNGYAVFDGTPTDSHGGDGALPAPSEGPVVSPLWQDLALHDTPAGALCAGTFGTGTDREFVLEWQDANPSGSPTAHLTFEAVLHEGTGVIDFLYSRMDPGVSPPEESGGAWASIGLQAGADGRFALHTGEVSTQYGIRWTPGQ